MTRLPGVNLPLRLALPLMISLLVFGSVSIVMLLFHARSEQAVLALAGRGLAQFHEHVRDRAGEPDPDLRALARFLGSGTSGGDGFSFIIDSRGRVVAASENPAGGAAAAPALRVAAARHVVERRPAGSVLERTVIGAEEVLLAVTPVQRPDGSTWYAVSVLPEADLLSGIRAQRLQGMLLAGGTVLIAVLLGFLLAQRVSRPVEKLAEYMRRIGQGHLDEDILLTGFPEFMRLSFAVNRMVEGLRERLKLRQSLAMAKEVQRRLLPSAVPRYAGLDIAGRSYYCDETGGDYYDYLEVSGLPGETAVIAIGDVSGHGIASAMVMASARGILRSRCHDAGSLGDLLRHMNEQIVEDSGRGRFMTMLLAAVNAGRRELRWASAGHREPLVLDPETGGFRELHGGDVPLGVIAGVHFEDHLFAELRPGQIILLATDGLWEAQNRSGEHLGLERIAAAMTESADEGAAAICGAIAVALLEFCGGVQQADDITFVVVKIL
jgi:sigma-B regulation protein RsbU (phosphoserine phosphatase)